MAIGCLASWPGAPSVVAMVVVGACVHMASTAKPLGVPPLDPKANLTQYRAINS